MKIDDLKTKQSEKLNDGAKKLRYHRKRNVVRMKPTWRLMTSRPHALMTLHLVLIDAAKYSFD